MVVTGAFCNNWMSSAGSPWLDKAQPRSAATNDQEKEVAIDTKSTDNNNNYNGIDRIAQDPRVGIAGATRNHWKVWQLDKRNSLG